MPKQSSGLKPGLDHLGVRVQYQDQSSPGSSEASDDGADRLLLAEVTLTRERSWVVCDSVFGGTAAYATDVAKRRRRWENRRGHIVTKARGRESTLIQDRV